MVISHYYVDLCGLMSSARATEVIEVMKNNVVTSIYFFWYVKLPADNVGYIRTD